MKLLFILLTLLIGASANAGTWVKQTDIKSPARTWTKKQRCETQEADTCLDTAGKDVRRWMVGTVDDLPALVADSAGSDQADTDDAAAATDKSTRATKRSERSTDAATCVAAVNGASTTLTGPEIKACVAALVKQMFESQIATGDL